MRILQLIQKKQLRGAEIFAAQLSTHLVNAGHEVWIASLTGGEAMLPFAGRIISLDVSLQKKLYDLAGWKALAKIIREFKPDVIQANAGDTLRYAVMSKKIFRWKQPLIFRNASMVSRYIKNGVSKFITAFLLKNCDHIVSVSEFTKKDLLSNFSLAHKKISVIPVGIEFRKHERINALDDSLINLVHVGGFSFEKNHERLLQMFKELHRKNNRFRLWLIGDGPLMAKMKSLASALQLTDKVFFKGFVPDPLNYIYSARALLLPSIIEGLPAVILESFYCKTPVVAYNVGGISELVKNGKTGWLVEAGKESDFVDAVIEVSQASKGVRDELTGNAYEKLMTHYTNKQIAMVFLEIYQQQKRVDGLL